MLVDFFFLFDEYVVPLPISFDSSWFSYWNGYTCILFLGYLCLECLSPCLFFPEVMLILVGYVCFLDAAIRWIMIFASILLVCVFLLLESKPLVLREIDDRWLLIPDFIFIVIVGAVVGCVCLYVSVIFFWHNSIYFLCFHGWINLLRLFSFSYLLYTWMYR